MEHRTVYIKKWVDCEGKWTEDIQKAVSDYWQRLIMHKVPFFSPFPPSNPFPLQSLQPFKYYMTSDWLWMNTEDALFLLHLRHYIQLPAFTRLRWLWQCGMEPASIRWISLVVPWGIIGSQRASVTDCSPCHADSPLLVINGELPWQSERCGELSLFLKYLQYKLNIWINQYLYKEKKRARVVTPVWKVCPVLSLFFLLPMHNQLMTREGAPTEANESETLSAWPWADVGKSFLWWERSGSILLSLSFGPRGLNSHLW